MTMTNGTNKTSLRTAALIAGLAILMMAIAAPFAELYVYPKLVAPGKAAEIAALLNLVTVFRLLNTPEYLTVFEPDQLYAQVILSLNAFKRGWNFGILFFGIHLGLLGYLVFRSNYIPRILAVLLIIAGLGYLITSLKPFLFPNMLHLAKYTFYGELIFMLWLLIKGSRIKEESI